MVLVGKLKPRIKPTFVRKPVDSPSSNLLRVDIGSSVVTNANSVESSVPINSNERINGKIPALVPVHGNSSNESASDEINLAAPFPKIYSPQSEENSNNLTRKQDSSNCVKNVHEISTSQVEENANGTLADGQSFTCNSSVDTDPRVDKRAPDEQSPNCETANPNVLSKKPLKLKSECKSKSPSDVVNEFEGVSSIDRRTDSKQNDSTSDLLPLKTPPKPNLLKKPPRIMKVIPNISRSCRPVPNKLQEQSSLPLKAAKIDVNHEKEKIKNSVENDPKNSEVVDVFVNECGEKVVVIDTTCEKSKKSSEPPALVAESRTLSESSDSLFNSNSKEGSANSDPVASQTEKPEKNSSEEVKLLCAVSAVDYLRRHDHALGDSILRRIIVGNSKHFDKSSRPSTCPSCNPQTLRKCLISLSSYDQDGLEQVLKKSAERQKTAVTFSNFPGKSTFKPSLGRQRAPTLTASTYGKMSYEVKEGLSKKYGTNTPELSKLRMLDLIFYNPSNNPMSNSTAKVENQSESSKGKENVCTSSSEKSPSVTNAESDAQEELSSKMTSNTDTNDPSVPRVRIGDEGQIILAPESLVVRNPESDICEVPIHHETGFSNRQKQDSHRLAWNFEETLTFYKALHSIGTDFSSMLEVFPSRTRKNLKAKFKREERKNFSLVDKVLKSQGREMNISEIERDLSMDKTLRRLCVETSRCKKKSDNSVGSIVKKNGRKKRARFNSDEEVEHTSDVLVNTEQNERIVSVENTEDGTMDNPEPINPEKPSEDNDLINKEIDPCSDKNAEVYEEPTLNDKKKRTKKTDSLPRKKRRTKPNGKIKVVHTLNADSSSEEDRLSNDTPTSPTVLPNCVVIQANIRHKEFNCSRSVRLNLDNPDAPLEINETIEHKEADDVSDGVEADQVDYSLAESNPDLIRVEGIQSQ